MKREAQQNKKQKAEKHLFKLRREKMPISSDALIVIIPALHQTNCAKVWFDPADMSVRLGLCG